MANYQEATFRLTNTHLNKLNSAAKNKTENNIKRTRIRNAIANDMSTNIKLIKTQISKIIQSGGSFGS